METCTALCSTSSCVIGWVDSHAGAIVAAVAIIFTARQVAVARTHNRLSVRPRLVFHVDTVDQIGLNAGVKLSVRNFGLGPAFIHAIEYRVGGKLLDIHDPAAAADAVTAIFGQRWGEILPMFKLMGIYAIPKDGVLYLAECQTDRLPQQGKDPLPILREAVSVVVRYTSPYDEALECSWPEPESPETTAAA